MAQATVDNNTRRRDFLALTAAAATSVMAARPALARPTVHHFTVDTAPDSSKAGQALKDAVIALGDSHDALEARKAEFAAADAKVSRWVEEHPEPTGKRPRKRWARKWCDYRDEVCTDAWEAQIDAERHFRKAQGVVAMIHPADRHELALMAAAAAIYDRTYLGDGRSAAIISYGVVLGYFMLLRKGEVS